MSDTDLRQATAELRAELDHMRLARDTAEERLRETLAAMIQHQQVGKCGNFRYNTATGAITGTEEVFKMLFFPPGTISCSVEEWLLKLHPDDRPRIEEEFFDTIARRQDMRFEYRIVLDAVEKDIRCDGEPDLEFKGDLVYFGVLTDITERKASEQAQRVMEAEFAAALRLASLGELAGSIIHEVNQPLTAIAMSASALRRWLAGGPENSDRALNSLERISEESQRAAEIISGLRSLVGNVSAEPASFDFNAAAREVCALMMSELARENVLLEAKYDTELPMAFGHRVQIQQVLMNLSRNAIEAMRANQTKRVLAITTSRKNGMISLRVADTGIGFTASDAELLFTPLYTTKDGGLGLGLSISRRIAQAHGGSLSGNARADGGADFQLLMPAEKHNHD